MKKIFLFIVLLFTYSCYKPNDYKKYKVHKSNVGYDSISNVQEDNVPLTDTISVNYIKKDKISNTVEIPNTITSNKKGIKKSSKLKNKKKNIKKNKSYDLGNVVYNIPDTMIVFNSYIIKVRINKITNIINIKGNLGPGRIVDTVIKISDKMEVVIKDESTGNDKYFEISKVNNDQQLIEEEDYTEWIFNVKPLKFGNKKLNIVISIVKDGSKKEIVYTDSIYIKMNVKNEVQSFWSKYWQWCISTFIIPIFIYFWKRKNKKTDND